MCAICRFDVFSAGYVGLELLHFLTKDTLRLVAMTVQDVINAQRAAGEMDPAQRARVNEIAANYKKHVQALTEKLVDLKIAVFEYKETRNANARQLVSRHCSFMLYLFKNMCQLQGLDYQTHPGAQSMVAYATDFASLLQKMLFANPKERLSPAALLQHPFFLRHMPAHYAAEIETFYNEPASVVERPADSQVQSVVSALRASPTDRARRHVSWGADRVHNVENTHYPIPKNPKGK